MEGTTREGRVAIVTGAARGIGLAIARRLLSDGTHVASSISASATCAASTAS